MQRNCTFFLLIIALIAVTCAGCGRVERKAENQIAEALKERIGPAKSYDVNISGSPLRLLKGKMDRLDIVGKDVQLENGIQVALLSVSIHDLVFDPDTKEIKRAGNTLYSAKMTQRELTRYLTKTYPDVPELKIGLRDGLIDVSAKPCVAGVGVGIKAEADLHVEDRHNLVLDLKKVSAAGVPAPGFAKEYIETKFNPVLDSNDLGFNATVNSLKLSPGSITISGNLDLVGE
ncbi:MAG: LmeA family phospholipid-binding protein [Armatimonadota bacterium]